MTWQPELTTARELMAMTFPWKETGHVYVIRSYSGLFKIGMATSVFERIEELRCMSPVDLVIEMWWPVPDMAAAERKLHRLFRHKRDHGEWFALDEVDLMSLRCLRRYSDFWPVPAA